MYKVKTKQIWVKLRFNTNNSTNASDNCTTMLVLNTSITENFWKFYLKCGKLDTHNLF